MGGYSYRHRDIVAIVSCPIHLYLLEPRTREPEPDTAEASVRAPRCCGRRSYSSPNRVVWR